MIALNILFCVASACALVLPGEGKAWRAVWFVVYMVNLVAVLMSAVLWFRECAR